MSPGVLLLLCLFQLLCVLCTQGDKRQPYEENIRVPLIVRGPNVAPNTHTSSIALSIDLVSGVRIMYHVVVVYCFSCCCLVSNIPRFGRCGYS